MQLSSFSDDILRPIADYVVSPSYCDWNKWKEVLKILQVCRNWRQASLPSVCKCALIIQGNMSEKLDSTSNNEEARKTTSADFVSNLELISSMYTTDRVRHVYIKLDDSFDTILTLQQVYSQLFRYFNTNNKVTGFSLDYPYSSWSNSREIGFAHDVVDFMQSLTKLGKLFPRILSLRLLQGFGSRSSRYYGMRLCEMYAAQLRVIDFNIAIDLGLVCTFNSLTSMKLSTSNNTGVVISYLCAPTLKQLHLSGISSVHPWIALPNTSANPVVEFPQLSKLHIKYDNQTHRAPFTSQQVSKFGEYCRCTLLFPRLDSLDIVSYDDHCVVLQSGVFPPEMRQFVISGPTHIIEQLAKVNTQVVCELNINLETAPGESAQSAVAAINHMSDNLSKDANVVLKIGNFTPFDYLEALRCNNHIRLEVQSVTTIETMIGIIRRLKNADHIAFRKVNLETMPAYFRVPDLDDSDDEDGGFVATHIETNLGILELEYCYANYPTCDVNLLVKYLALNIPSLTTLRSRGAFAPQIHEFVEQYQGLYSHLTRIKFELPRVKGFRRFL